MEHATSLFVVILAGRSGELHEGSTRFLVRREVELNGVLEGGEGVESASCCDQPRGSPTITQPRADVLVVVEHVVGVVLGLHVHQPVVN